jgi:uncharacterized protein YcnI
MKLRLALLASLIAAGSAQAHVVLSVPEAPSGSYYVGAFRVGHGCSGSATTAIRFEVPVETPNAKPQPKPGWTLSIERERLPQPVKGEGGAMTSERVKAITWRGRLPDEQFDEFGVRLQLPDRDGALALPVVQTCEKGEARWVDPAGEHPAPKLTLTKKNADPMAGHMH